MEYCKQLLNRCTFYQDPHQYFALGRSPLNVAHAFEIKHYPRLLGDECNYAIYDAFDCFRPNAIMALAGTVINGGVMVLCCPPLDEWPVYNERSTQHYLSFADVFSRSIVRENLVKKFKQSLSTVIFSENNSAKIPQHFARKTCPKVTQPFYTQDQHTGFLALADIPQGKSAIITADRGRGKSTLLGLLAGQWLLKGRSVTVTSRHSRAVTQVFAGLSLICPAASFTSELNATLNSAFCEWLPLDHPTLNENNDRILLVDEAASIPLPQLKRICQSANTLILSTTMRGYEGSGRGFITRFLPWIQAKRPDLQHISLTTPIRWSNNDPLEQFWYDAFYLQQVFAPPTTSVIEAVEHEKYEIKELCSAKAILSYLGQILQLLMQAHYQTTTDELIRLCDSPNNRLLIAMADEQIIGVLNYQLEGGAQLSSIAADACSGTRRVNGHLSAQSLGLLAALPTLVNARYWRVNRIAVNDKIRGKGVGTRLIQQLIHNAQSAGISAITTSFGVTPTLLRFWHKLAFIPCKPGLKQDAASGEFSILMALPMSTQFWYYQSLLLAIYLQDLAVHPMAKTFDSNIEPMLANQPPTKELIAVNERVLQQVDCGSRNVRHATGSIHWLAQTILDSRASHPVGIEVKVEVITAYIKTIGTPEKFIQKYNLVGKKAVQPFIKKHVHDLLQYYLHNLGAG